MKKEIKKTAAILMALIMLTTTFSATMFNTSAAIVTENEVGASSGTTGDYCTWILDNEGTLTISGNGAMLDYSESDNPPWKTETKVKKVIINDGVTNIGNYAFFSNKQIKSVSIPDSVKSIGEDAFGFCKALESIDIPNSVESIGNGAFESCENLTSVVIPNSVTSLGKAAFYHCIKLEKVTLPNNISAIGAKTFWGCDAMATITIPSCVNSIENQAFGYGSQYNKMDGFVIRGESGSEAQRYAEENYFVFLTVKSGKTGACTWTLDDEGTLTISGNGEMENYKTRTSPPWGKTVKNVIINSGVTNIGNYAFCECKNLTGITIPDSVTSIGKYSFAECANLTNISIPDSVTTIEDNAFEQCSELMTLIIPDSVTSIGFWAFEYCTKLTAITIPDSVTIIRSFSFMGCPDLTIYGRKDSDAETYARSNDILFGTMIDYGTTGDCTWEFYDDGTLMISGNGAMDNYDDKELTTPWQKYKNEFKVEIENVIINYGVKNIGDYAFAGCSKLERAFISDGVTSIGFMAFYKCQKLTDITIPDSVTNIGYQAFNDTNWYNNQSDGIVYAGKVAVDYKGEMQDNTSLKIKKGTTGIGVGAFADLTNLKEITIPHSVKSIDSFAFVNCSSLLSVDIPTSVEFIGDKAFGYCVSPFSFESETINTFYTAVIELLKDNTLDNTFKEIIDYIILDKTPDFIIKVMDSGEGQQYADDNDLNWELKSFDFKWENDTWSFDNTEENFKVETIKDDDINKYKDIIYKLKREFNLSSYNIEGNIGQYYREYSNLGNGFCFGMTLSEIFVKQGLIKLSDYQWNNNTQYKISDNIHENNNDDNILIFINFLQQLQYYGSYNQANRFNAVYNNKTSQFYQENSECIEDAKKIISDDCIRAAEKELKNNDRLILIVYSNNGKDQHAVLGYGIQSADDYNPDSNPDRKVKFDSVKKMWSFNDSYYNNRILIADPNHLSENKVNDDACIYYNSDNYSWIIPSKDERQIDCFLKINNSLTDPEFYPNILNYIAGITIVNEKGKSAKIKSENNVDIYDITDSVNKELTEYELDISDLDDKELKVYALDNWKKECVVEYEKPSDYSISMDYENVTYFADVKGGTQTVFSKNDCISLKGKNASYTLTMTRESESANDWNEITVEPVEGQNANEVTIKRTKNGYMLDSDNLNVKITVKNTANDNTKEIEYNNSSGIVYINVSEIKVSENGLSTYDLGDVTFDRDVNVDDVTMIQRNLAKISTFDKNQNTLSDLNCNGEIDIDDVTLLQKYIALYNVKIGKQ